MFGHWLTLWRCASCSCQSVRSGKGASQGGFTDDHAELRAVGVAESLLASHAGCDLFGERGFVESSWGSEQLRRVRRSLKQARQEAGGVLLKVHRLGLERHVLPVPLAELAGVLKGEVPQDGQMGRAVVLVEGTGELGAAESVAVFHIGEVAVVAADCVAQGTERDARFSAEGAEFLRVTRTWGMAAVGHGASDRHMQKSPVDFGA